MRRLLCLLACLLSGAPLVSGGTLPPGFIEVDIGGTWDEAVALHFGPGNRMYVVERKGKVWIVENGVRLSQPFVDIRQEVGGWRDYGLLGFALHPNFTANGYVQGRGYDAAIAHRELAARDDGGHSWQRRRFPDPHFDGGLPASSPRDHKSWRRTGSG